jgi:predicted  nucleic acid-binding Zn-ribbon protein
MLPNDPQTLMNWAFSAITGILAWFGREIYREHKILQESAKQEISRLREEVARDLVRKDDLREQIAQIRTDVREGFKSISESLHTLNEKLDRKADK